jgi:hypothetical protein
MSYLKKNLPSLLVFIVVCFLISCAPQSPPAEESSSGSEMPMAGSAPEAAAPPSATHAHSDHDSKHGGTFFMALDNEHHLEGLLVPPGVFRVYLYDEYTHPLSAAALAQTQAEVIWGDVDGAAKLSLKPSPDGTMLEVSAPEPVRFPITLTLLMRFPGAKPDQRSELFTFPFSHYSNLQPDDH